MKVAIGVCSARDWRVNFATSLLSLVCYTVQNGIGTKEFGGLHVAVRPNCSLLCYGWQHILDEAISGGFTHIMWLADDIEFPEDSLARLADHDKPFVGINMLKKHDAHDPTAVDLDGRVISSVGRSGLEEVTSTTMALSLAEIDLLKAIPAPLFASSSSLGEDAFYFSRIRSQGHSIFVDHDLSKRCGHIGDRTFRF